MQILYPQHSLATELGTRTLFYYFTHGMLFSLLAFSYARKIFISSPAMFRQAIGRDPRRRQAHAGPTSEGPKPSARPEFRREWGKKR